MKEFLKSETFKGIRDTVGAIIVMLVLVTGANLLYNSATIPAQAASTPVESSYKPGTASYVDYDYIRIDGSTYIIFRDKYTNSIAVVPKY